MIPHNPNKKTKVTFQSKYRMPSSCREWHGQLKLADRI